MPSSKRRVEIALSAVDKFTAPFRAVERHLQNLHRRSGLAAFSAQLNQTSDAAAALWRRIRPLATGIGILGGAAFGAGAVALKGFVDEASHLDDVSKRLGITSQALQKIEYAAGQFGVEAGEVEAGLRIFNKNVGLAAMGGKEQAKVFRGLGISLKGPNGRIREASDLFMAFSERLVRVKDPQRQAALAMAAFGKGATSLLPVLRQGPEALRALMDEVEQLRAVMGDDAVAAGDAFGDNLQRVGLVAKGLRNVVGFELTKAFTPAIEGFISWYKEGKNAELVHARVASAVQRLVGAGRDFTGWLFGTALPAADRFAESLGGWRRVIQGVAAIAAASFGITILGPLVGLVWNVGKLAFAFKGLLWPALKGGIGVLGAVLQIMKALSLALLANPWALLAIAAVAAGVAIYHYWEPIKAFFADLWADVTEAFDRAIDRIKSGWEDLVGWLRRKVDLVRGLLPSFLGGGALPAASFGGVQGGASTTSPAPARAPVPVAARSQETRVGGRVEIVLRDPTGRARLQRMQTQNPDVPLDFDAGPVMNPAWG